MPNAKTIFLAFLITIFLIIFYFFGWLSFPEKIINFFVSQTSSLIYKSSNSAKNFLGRWTNYRDFFEENQQCSRKISILAVNQSELKELKEENQILRAQLNFLKEEKKYVNAEIIGKIPDSSINILIINKGSDDGVDNDAAVISGNGVLIGKIVKVKGKTSWVRILTDNQSKIAATVLNSGKTIGIVKGEYNLRLKLIMVPLTEKIQVGDQVVSSAIENGVPKGLAIGQIESIEKELFQPFQTAVIKPWLDFNKINIVAVLKSDS